MFDVNQIVIPKNAREEIRIGREEWQGHDLINVRIWAGTGDNERRPTRKGLAVKVDQAGEVADAINKMLGADK